MNGKIQKVNFSKGVHLWIVAVLTFCVLRYCPAAYSQESIPPISESEWSKIFLEITDISQFAPDNKDQYVVAVMNFAKGNLTTAAREMNEGNLSAGLKTGLVGHLLGWYVSELRSVGGSESSVEMRAALLRNRRAYVQKGLTADTLEASFMTMNGAARTLGLPTVSHLN